MDIIILAAIAIYIFFKLHQQFGKIDDDQKRNAIRNLIKEQTKIISPMKIVKDESTANNFPEIDQKSQKILEETAEDIRNDLLVILQKANISAAHFLDGAINAFEMVIEAFAAGDTEKLRLLLSEIILQQFTIAIEKHKNLGQILNTKIIAIDENKITSAKMLQNYAIITMRFVSRQINYVTDIEGKLIDGSIDEVNSIEDIWTFKKDCSNMNPNWMIVATNSSN